MDRWFPIRTQRLLLRELRPSDEPDIHAYGSDPVVSRFTHWGPNTPEQTSAVLAARLTAQQTWPRPNVTLALELPEAQKVIGGIELRDRGERSADFGYVLNRHYWNQGYCTEAARAVLDAAFRKLAMHRVWATCDIRNQASCRVLEKLGMRREACFRQDVLQKGEWRDSYLYAVLAEEWEEKTLPQL